MTEEELDAGEGLLIRSQGIPRGIIAVKKSIRSEGRKRFTVAHEIGHYVLPGHDEYGSVAINTLIGNHWIMSDDPANRDLRL